jgi:hypothetical protein
LPDRLLVDAGHFVHRTFSLKMKKAITRFQVMAFAARVRCCFGYITRPSD